jgi:hypothetical protein
VTSSFSSSVSRAIANRILEAERQQSSATHQQVQQDQTAAAAVEYPDPEETFRTLFDGFACKFPSQVDPPQDTNQSQTTLPRTQRASASIAVHTSSVVILQS